MKRNISTLTDWKKFEQKLLSDQEFEIQAREHEFEFVIADSVIQARKRKKLSQQELALKIGTKQPVISRLESAHSLPSLTLLYRIAKALEMQLVVKFQ